MKASFEKIERNVALLEVEVDAEQVDVAIDKAFKKVVQKVNVPGFRKGKVPRAIFERKFGVQSLYQDAMELLLPEAYKQAVEQTGITPVDQPDVDIVQFEQGQALVFKATVVVKPEVILGEYKGLDIAQTTPTVSKEDLAAELKRLQDRHAELVVLDEKEAVQNGDFTVIDFEGSIDGVLFPGGKGEKHSLEIGSNSFIPGFEEQIIGMVKDEEKDIHVTFPENYHSEDVAGKAAVFKVKLHESKRKVLPPLDDEFAKDVSEFETLAEFEADLKERLLKGKTEQAEREFETQVVDRVAENADFEIPDVMIEQEIDLIFQDFERRLSTQGMNLDLYYQFTGQNEDGLREQMRENAVKAVRNRLVLEAVVKAEQIEPTDEETDEELAKLAEQYKRSVDEIRAAFIERGSMQSFKKDLAISKAVKFLLEQTKPKKTRKKSAAATE